MAQEPAARVSRRALAFGALHHRGYRGYFVTVVLAMMADNIEHVITYWVIFQAFHSPALAGFAVISHWIPFLLFSVYTGALADRFDCRRLIQLAEGMFMLVSLAWGFLFVTGTLQAWHAGALLTLHGIAGVIFEPATQLIIYDMVGPADLQSAVRLTASSRYVSILLGPAVGGGLMLLLGPARGLLANVLIYLPLVSLMAVIPYTGHTHKGVAPSRRFGVGFREARQVLREVREDRRVFLMIVLGGVASLFVGNAFQAQMPEYAHHLGADEGGLQYSALLAANAAGAIVGTILLESTGLLQPKVRTAIVCATLWSIAMGLFPAAPSYGVALSILFVAGVLNITFMAMAQTVVQLLAPPDLRGRVLGFFNTASLGLRAGSGVSVGLLGGLIGIYWSLGLSAGALGLITLALLVIDVGAGPRGGGRTSPAVDIRPDRSVR